MCVHLKGRPLIYGMNAGQHGTFDERQDNAADMVSTSLMLQTLKRRWLSPLVAGIALTETAWVQLKD